MLGCSTLSHNVHQYLQSTEWLHLCIIDNSRVPFIFNSYLEKPISCSQINLQLSEMFSVTFKLCFIWNFILFFTPLSYTDIFGHLIMYFSCLTFFLRITCFVLSFCLLTGTVRISRPPRSVSLVGTQLWSLFIQHPTSSSLNSTRTSLDPAFLSWVITVRQWPSSIFTVPEVLWVYRSEEVEHDVWFLPDHL